MDKLQIKRGTKSTIPTLAAGELGYCTDTQELYIGASANVRLCGANDMGRVAKKADVYTKAEVYDKTEVYNKNEVYTKAEVDALIAGLKAYVDGLHQEG